MGVDNNPFDQLFLSPTPCERFVTHQAMDVDEREAADDVCQEVRSRRRDSNDLDMPPFRPALIDFHRKSGTTATPGSVSSEASFEGAGPGDYFRMYGYSPIDLSAYVDDTHHPSQTYFTPPSADVGPESPLEHPSTRMSVLSCASESTIRSASSGNTLTSLPSSSNSPTAAHIGVAGVARMSRPTLLRPRPRKRPYETTGSARQRETSSGAARGISFGEEQAEMREDGRSISEVMVAMAGLRCQRGRAVRI
jgi:hypothetical protein